MMEATQMKRKEFMVGGMTCASCAKAVENVLKKQNGIEKVEVSYANNSAKVEYNDSIVSISELESIVSEIGYSLTTDDGHQGMIDFEQQQELAYQSLRRKAIGALTLSVPVLVLGMFFMNVPWVNPILFALTSIIIWFFGLHFYVNAYKQIRQGQLTMDSLVALSTGVAYLYSCAVLFLPAFMHRLGLPHHVYFEAAAVIISFVLLGKMLEENARVGVGKAIQNLKKLKPEFSNLVNGDEVSQVHTSDVLRGDTLLIRKGENIPVDGNLLEEAFVDEQSISGEFGIKNKLSGDKVFEGSINKGEAFKMLAVNVGEHSLLAGIIRTVKNAQASKPPIQQLADKVAAIFVPTVIVLAIASAVFWVMLYGKEGFSQGLLSFVTVLVIACPCALGLATPTAIMAGMGRGSQKGILFKDATGLQNLGEIDTIVLDKTGTITEGKPKVTKVEWLFGDSKSYGVFIKSMELKSSHPLASAISKYFEDIDSNIIFQDVKEVAGSGMIASYFGKRYWIGSRRLAETMSKGEIIADEGNIYFGLEAEVIAIFTITDTIKPTSTIAIKRLKDMGLKVIMATGDSLANAQSVADAVGITSIFSSLLPEDKSALIKKIKAEGGKPAMVGDGINDSEALVMANVGIAMGHGSDIALDVASCALVNGDLTKLPEAISLSKSVMKVVKQNLFWAFIYNVIGIPIAMGVFSKWGISVGPMFASMAMALSSVSVVLNSLRLSRA